MNKNEYKVHLEPTIPPDRFAESSVMVFGLIATDLIFKLESMPKKAEKYIARDSVWGIGGGGANAALALQRLGGQAKLAGRTGDDQAAQLVLDKLHLEGVDYQCVLRLTDSRSAVSSVFIDADGDRQIVNFRGDVPNSPKNAFIDTWFEPSMLDDCNALLADTRWEAGAIAVLKEARSRQLPAVVDAEAPTSQAAMALATHIAFSRQGLREYAGTDDALSGLRQACKQFNCWACVTDGENGVYDLHDGQLRHIQGHSVNAVDTLGAGDVWHAAFTLQLGNGHSEFDAMNYANAAAALKCTRSGGATAAPTWQEVGRFIKRAQSG